MLLNRIVYSLTGEMYLAGDLTGYRLNTVLITCFFKKVCKDQRHTFKNVESYILILKSYKNHENWEVLCFFLAATSGNLCEVSLSPLPILLTCGIFFSLIYFLLFNFCVC